MPQLASRLRSVFLYRFLAEVNTCPPIAFSIFLLSMVDISYRTLYRVLLPIVREQGFRICCHYPLEISRFPLVSGMSKWFRTRPKKTWLLIVEMIRSCDGSYVEENHTHLREPKILIPESLIVPDLSRSQKFYHGVRFYYYVLGSAFASSCQSFEIQANAGQQSRIQNFGAVSSISNETAAQAHGLEILDSALKQLCPRLLRCLLYLFLRSKPPI